MPNGDDELAKYAVKPEDELAKYKTAATQYQQQPSLLRRAGSALSDIDERYIWPTASKLLGVSEGALFGGSGEAGGIAGGGYRTSDIPAALAMPAAEFAGGELGRKLFPKAPAPAWRDATRLNVPYAGEESPFAPEFMEREPKLNVPFAGEDIPKFDPQTWRDATRLNVPFAGEETAPVRTTPFSKGPSASFDLPSTVPERSSVPGAGGEAWSMQRKLSPELQTAASAGDPGAIQTMRRLNPTWSPIVTPKEAEFQAPSLSRARQLAVQPIKRKIPAGEGTSETSSSGSGWKMSQ